MNWYKQQGNYALKENHIYRISKFNSKKIIDHEDFYNWVLKADGENIYIKSTSEIECAFYSELWGEVDGYKMKIWNKINNKYSLEPNTAEMAKHFNVGFVPDKYESRYEAILKYEEEIDSIWEMRSPIEGLPFNTEKINYLKMYGEWLV